MQRLFILIYILFFSAAVKAQAPQAVADTAFQRILGFAQHAVLFNQITPQEKVYLHFDNTGYFKGETIRFKAYVVRADRSTLTDISHVLHVELLNSSGDIVAQRKLRLVKGMASGDFQLDSIFGTGFYEVRAFTRYMMNWGSTGVFSRVFPIFKKPSREGNYSHPTMDVFGYNKRLPNGRAEDSAATENVNTDKRGYNVSFYPEGGHLIKGMPCRVAYSITNKEGEHAVAAAIVVDADGETVASTVSERDGRGIFEIIPDGRELTFVVTDKDNHRHSFKLPATEDEGCVLKLDTRDEIDATFRISSSLCGQTWGYMLMHSGNVVQCDTMLTAPQIELQFERESLPAGVSQLTVFDSQGRIWAERLFFICPPITDADSIKIAGPAYKLNPCGRIHVNLTAAPNSYLSFSAMDAETLTGGRVGNANTWMLLSSEVRGYIDNPDYYFEADDAEHRRAADLLMMVQGWRRYDWKLQTGIYGFDSLEEYSGRMHPIEDKLYLSGVLKRDTRKFAKKHPVNGVDLKAILYNQQGLHMDGHTVTDSVGNYAFEMPEVDGEWTLLINTKYEGKDARYLVTIDRHFSPKARQLSAYELALQTLPKPVAVLQQMQDTLDDVTRMRLTGSGDNVAYVLPTVKVKARFSDNPQRPWLSEKGASSHASLYYDVDRATDEYSDLGESLPTLYSWLKTKNSFFEGTDNLNERYVVIDDDGNLESVDHGNFGVDTVSDYQHSVYMDGLTYHGRPVVWIVNNAYCTVSQYPRTKYLFETLTTNYSALMPLFIDEVKSVYVSEDEDYYKNFVRSDDLERLHPVTVFVYTHLRFAAPQKGLRRTHFQGYNVPTVFEMEDYSVMPPMDDFRRTIFWAPDVMTNSEGKASIDFFNNSTSNHLYMSAEGITTDGRFIVSE